MIVLHYRSSAVTAVRAAASKGISFGDEDLQREDNGGGGGGGVCQGERQGGDRKRQRTDM